MAPNKVVESWDDDLELEGPIPTGSVSTTYQNSISSRLSIRSESSHAGDDDWNVSLAPNDEQQASQAINSAAKLAGIPIPANVPSSALLGGTITKLGQKKSPKPPQKDDWDGDMDFPEDPVTPLKLKKREQVEPIAEDDDFDWAEGSLGIRHGGMRLASKTMSPSSGLRTPSMASVKTAESEDDGTGGLLFPAGPLDFEAALKKRQETIVDELPADLMKEDSGSRPTTSSRPTSSRHEKEESFDDFDFGPGNGNNIFDLKKRTANPHLVNKDKLADKSSPAPKVQATLTFNDRSAPRTRIPQPVPSIPRPSRLEPVFESGANNVTRARVSGPMATNKQLLRSKRSAPTLRQQQPMSRHPPVPSLPPTMASQNRAAQARLPPYGSNRRESDPNRAQSPTFRPQSRLSHAMTPDTPTRQRRNLAPAALIREAAAQRRIDQPLRKRNFGDGTELDTFDDLPTSATKEHQYNKQPVARVQGNHNSRLRHQPSVSRLGVREKMVTPMPPQTPRSPTKKENLPSFARDTVASKIAREQTVGGPSKPSPGGALMNRTNQSFVNLLRTPQTSPSAKRTAARKGPTLIAPMGKENTHRLEAEAAEKGMLWNAVMYRWEGHDIPGKDFDPAPPPSPPRPALITNFGQSSGAMVVGDMVFDNHSKRWLKLGLAMSDPRSPSVGDDDDPFQDIEDLKDDETSTAGGGLGSAGELMVVEEFDVGPAFIARQREEEVTWREKISAWFGEEREREGEQYKWMLRDYAANALGQGLA